MKDHFLKRLRKKAKRGMHGWPAATIAFYGPDASRASKVVVGIFASEHAEIGEMRNKFALRPAYGVRMPGQPGRKKCFAVKG